MPLYALAVIHASAGPEPVQARSFLGGTDDRPGVLRGPAEARKYSTIGDATCAADRPSPRLAEWLRLRSYRVEVVKICDANQYEAPVPGEAVPCTAANGRVRP